CGSDAAHGVNPCAEKSLAHIFVLYNAPPRCTPGANCTLKALYSRRGAPCSASATTLADDSPRLLSEAHPLLRNEGDEGNKYSATYPSIRIDRNSHGQSAP